jgi:hypothetical protein
VQVRPDERAGKDVKRNRPANRKLRFTRVGVVRYLRRNRAVLLSKMDDEKGELADVLRRKFICSPAEVTWALLRPTRGPA